jgi:dTDP-4-amino-4,6-dideoxygalactose transaminase
MRDNPIYVTKPSLAPLEEFTFLLKGVWDRGILTHNGPLVQKFENDFSNKIKIKNFVAVTNGTVAIQMAIKGLELKGEIITTPFTWIATVSAIKWEGCEPVFCDINSETLNMDVNKIEALITEKTVAIMPVHVFGNPCDVINIERIAKKHGLKVIYDGAHAVGSNYMNRSLLEFGDITTTSLHATKLINTAEGGGCVTTDDILFEKLKRIRFFGHDNSKDIIEDGLNGKLTEIHAALGIANLKYYDDVLLNRKTVYNKYKEALSGLENIKFQKINTDGEINYSYFPIIFDSEKLLLSTEKILNSNNIFPRRYFYPSVNQYIKILKYSQMPISEDISSKILCLPLYYGIKDEEIEEIISLTTQSINGGNKC